MMLAEAERARINLVACAEKACDHLETIGARLGCLIPLLGALVAVLWGWA